MDCDSFVLSSRTENTFNNLNFFGYQLEYSNLDKNHDLFSIKKLVGKSQIETPESIQTVAVMF